MPTAVQRRQSLFRALSDSTRRDVLEQLATRDAIPALDLSRGFGSSQPAFSKHLRVLRDAGLVRVRSSGRQQLYSLDPRPLQFVDDWITPFRRFWTARLDALGRHLKEEA